MAGPDPAIHLTTRIAAKDGCPGQARA